MNVGPLITKVILPLGGLALMTANLIFVAKGIVLPIQRTVRSITGGADEMAEASEQIASASNSLAKGSTEQAAAIEETSSSLEEMSAMTRQNAATAEEAAAASESICGQADRMRERVGELSLMVFDPRRNADGKAMDIRRPTPGRAMPLAPAKRLPLPDENAFADF